MSDNGGCVKPSAAQQGRLHNRAFIRPYRPTGNTPTGSPVLLASRVTVGAGQVTTVGTSSGIMIRVPAGTPPLDPNHGWWGVVVAGKDPGDRLVHWTRSLERPLLVPPGNYDIVWRRGLQHKPETIRPGIAVGPGQFVEVELR